MPATSSLAVLRRSEVLRFHTYSSLLSAPTLPFSQVYGLFGCRGINQQRHIGNASSLEAVHNPLVPPGTVAKIISRHHQHHSGLWHDGWLLWRTYRRQINTHHEGGCGSAGKVGCLSIAGSMVRFPPPSVHMLTFP